jgi:acetyl esterase/lipase
LPAIRSVKCRLGRRRAGPARRWAARALVWAAVPLGAAAAPVPFRVEADRPYLAPGRAEHLDLYLPESPRPSGGRPAVVYLHGGGWVKGDKAEARDRNIAGALAGAGFVVASANYRLGAKSWPGNLEDCRNAVRYLRARAAECGVAPDRIAIMGASAGGHLALLVAFGPVQAATGEPPVYPGVAASVRAVVDLYGVTDLLSRLRARLDGTPTSRWEDSHASEMLGVSPDQDRAAWLDASPIAHLAGAVPPVLIVHGLADPIVDYPQAVELADALGSRGVEHQLLLVPAVGHLFDLDRWKGHPLPVDVHGAVIAFLARHLPPPP